MWRLVLVLLLAGALGCASAGSHDSLLMERAGATEITASELRTRVRALSGPFSGLLEEAADRVLDASSQAEVRERALLWKIHNIPAMQAALLQPDPLAALFDAWVLVIQMERSLDDPAQGYTTFEQEVGRSAIAALLVEIESLAKLIRVDDDIEALREPVESWAREHPILDTSAARTPATQELARFTANTRVRVRETMSLLTETRNDFAVRADLYAAYLPKQARWHAELLITQLLHGSEWREAVPELAVATASLDRISTTVEALPGLVTEERQAILEAVTQERLALLEALDQELEQTLSFVTDERLAIFEKHIAEERRLILEAITAERIAAFESLRQERIETMDAVASLTQGVVDHVLLRLAQLLAVALVVVGLPVFWLLFRFSRSREA